MSNRPTNGPRRRPDPYAAWRHLDGRVVTVATHDLTEDPDGLPLGVQRIEHEGLLILPTLPEEGNE